jgi:hypothetical protein
MAKESMNAIQCGNCNVLVPLLNQFQVAGVPTFEYHCTRCNGKVHLQLAKNPQTGETYAKQIRLTGSPEEFRPQSIRPNSQMQIPVAYTLGSSRSASHVRTDPIMPPPPAYRLGAGGQGGGQLAPNHPMHPNQIRKRIQPIRWG